MLLVSLMQSCYSCFSNMIHHRHVAVTGQGSAWDYVMTDELSLGNRNQGVSSWNVRTQRASMKGRGPERRLSTLILIVAGVWAQVKNKTPVSNAFSYTKPKHSHSGSSDILNIKHYVWSCWIHIALTSTTFTILNGSKIVLQFGGSEGFV